MNTYFRAFVNYEQNNWTRLLPIAEFIYNNAKNTGIEYMPFEINNGYHSNIFYKEEVGPHFRSKVANKLTKELRNLMAIQKKNL